MADVEPTGELIVPGETLGPIVIGMSTNDVVQALGTPDEVESTPDPGGPPLTSYEYEDLALRVGFSPAPWESVAFMSTKNPRYRTREGIGVGSSGRDVMHTFAESTYQRTWSERANRIYLRYVDLGLELSLTPDNIVRGITVNLRSPSEWMGPSR